MTKKQLIHYLKGGKFTAIYNPTKLDISFQSKQMIGKEIIVYQNMIVSPIIHISEYEGQHAFNSENIYGWFPEEDIKIINIIDDFIAPESLPKYMYKLHYTKENKIEGNFGKNQSLKVPFFVGIEYSWEMDGYVLSLSNPQACKIEKAVWNGEKYKNIKWITIYSEI